MTFASRVVGFSGAGFIVNPISGNGNDYTDQIGDPGGASSAIRFNTNGSMDWISNGTGTVDIPTGWFFPVATGIGSSYWVRATVTAGTFSSGTVDTWLALSSARSWSVIRNAPPGSKSCTATYEIASDSGGTTIVSSASITVTAEVTP
jgi:hypothetical protein